MMRKHSYIFLGISVLSLALAAPARADIEWNGRVRYRIESINSDAAAASPTDDEGTNFRHRISALLGLKAKPTESITTGFGLSTGGTDRISTNQTLDASFSRKAISIDLAYADWDLGGESHLVFGKQKNVFYRPGGSELLFDSDLNPEGIAYQHKLAEGEKGLDGALGFFAAIENGSQTRRDSYLAGLQLGYSLGLGESDLKVNAGYYSLLFASENTPSATAGNAVDGAGHYASDFGIIQGGLELGLNVGMPLLVFSDLAINGATDSDDSMALLAGARVGKLSDAKDWAFTYQFRRVEAESVIGALSDSDSAGGGTGNSGHKFNLAYRLAGKGSGAGADLGATFFLNQLGTSGDTLDYSRGQLDFTVRF